MYVSGRGANHLGWLLCFVKYRFVELLNKNKTKELGSMYNGAVVVLSSPEFATEGGREGMRYLDVRKVG